MRFISLPLLFSLLVFSSYAQVKKWDGGAGTSNWSDAINWDNNILPTLGDSVYLDHSLVSGSYTVMLPNALVNIKCLSIYPSSGSDSIFVEVPTSNTVSPNIRVTGIGYNAIRIGNRGRFNNRSGAPLITPKPDVFAIDDINNYGVLIDNGGYYYHATRTSDINVLSKLSTKPNSTFEFNVSSSYTNLIFPIGSSVTNVTFYHLIFSGNTQYGGTLAHNWDLIINGDLTIRNGASFGVVRGAVGQVRYVRFRGNINIVNTSNTLWFESTASASFGWYTVFEGNNAQTINKDITFLDSTTINNPHGVYAQQRFEIKSPGFAAIDPELVLKDGLLNTTGSGYVYMNLTTPGKINGHSVSSYINGILKIKLNSTGTTGTYDLPVGTATNYELAVLNLNAVKGISNLTTQFLTTPLGTIPTPLSETPKIYETLLDAGFWRITPNASLTGGNYSVQLYERGYSSSNYSYYTVVKRNNEFDNWALYGSHVSYNETTTVIDAKRSNITSFSDFAIAHPITTLPVTLIDFNVSSTNNELIDIQWKTANEINNHYFTIEKSKDGVDWEVINYTYSKGNGQTIHEYNIVDQNISSEKIWYYRLKQTDYDGMSTYSPIKSLELHVMSFISIYPNPASNIIHLSGLKENPIYIPISSLTGEVYKLALNKTEIIDKYQINIEQLPEGIYFININGMNYKIYKVNP
jgi:hypothetical protein